MGKSGIVWRVAVALFILIGALIGFYWAHKPLDPALLTSAGGAALDLLTTALIVMVGGGLGRRLTQMLVQGDSGLSRPERLALEGSIGLGAISISLLIVGLVGLFNAAVLWLLLIVLGIFNLRLASGWVRDLIAVSRRAAQPETSWTRFLLIVTLLFLSMALLHAFMPPTAYDALNYHLVGPKHYLAAGRIVADPDNLFLGFPQNIEMLYTLALGLLGRDTSAAPLHWVFGLFALLASGGLIKRYTDATHTYLVAALLMSAFSLWSLMGWPYVDLAMLTYGALALVTLERWQSTQNTRWLIAVGVLAGLALGVKYTGAGLLLAIGGVLLVSQPRQIVRNGLIVGFITLLMFLPWALKGLLLYHNPVYPFVFGGLNWDAGRSNTFSTTGTGLLGSPDAWQLPILPIAATIFGVEKGGSFSFTVGPWLLIAPLLLIPDWRWLDARGRSLARLALGFGLPILLFWGVMAALSAIGIQTRLAIMGLPAAVLLAGLALGGLAKWPRKPLDMAFVARALLVLTLIFAGLDALRETARSRAADYLLGNLSRAGYQDENLGIYINAMRELTTLPEGTQVRFMFEPRTYYCPSTIKCSGDILFDYWARALRQGMTWDEVFTAWQDSGDDYLLTFNLGYDFNVQDTRFTIENANFPAALIHFMRPIWTDKVRGYTLWEWR